MTHAYKNTLIARLGFDDVDRRRPDHDPICQYVVDSAKRLVTEHIVKDVDALLNATRKHSICRPKSGQIAFVKAEMEKPITNARGWSVGFLDVYIQYRAEGLMSGVHASNWCKKAHSHDGYDVCGLCKELKAAGPWCDLEGDDGWRSGFRCHSIGVEVKTHFESLNEPLRQLLFYREHIPAHMPLSHWVLLSPVVLSVRDIRLLRQQDIEYVRLNRDSFAAWKERSE